MKRVTWKQIAAMAMCLLMLVIILPSRSTEAASSTAPAKITEDVVVARIKKLQTAFSGKYFTTTQKSCGNSHCTKCNAGNVIKQAWVKSAIDLVPKSLSMAHYYYSGAWTNGWSCCGFANFAGWYIFAQKSTDKVQFKQVATGSFNYSTMNKAKPGDLIRLGSVAKRGEKNSTHSAVVISVSSSGVQVLDCNFKHYNYVYTHTIGYKQFSKYKYVTISRAKNYNTSVSNFKVTYDANGGKGAPGSQTKIPGQSLTLSTVKPTRANESAGSFVVRLDPNGGVVNQSALTASRTTSFVFDQWNAQQDGSGQGYDPGAAYVADEDATLYAQWAASTRTNPVTLPAASKSSSAFDGWYTAPSGGSRVGGEGDSFEPKGDGTLYAHWGKGVTFKKQPKNVSVKSGSKAKFTVKVAEKNVTYQWYSQAPGAKEWTAVPGATKAIFSVVASKTNQGWQYRCGVRVRNGGETYSNAASLTVKLQPPKFTTQPKNITATKLGTTVKFKAKASGKNVTYQWYYRILGDDEWAKVSDGTQSTLRIYVGSTISWQFRCLARNGDGEVYSSIATLTVKLK